MTAKSGDELRALLQRMEHTADFSELTLADVNAHGNLGNTPLHIAAVWGDVNAINCLLDHGAVIDAIGEFGETPLHVAVQMKHPPAIKAEVVKALIARGASTQIKNRFGKTPGELARELDPSIVKLFE